MTDSTELQHPTAILKSEHQTILRVIGALERLVARSERGDGFEHAAMRQCVEFFQLFADACHHAKEEDLLFPALEAQGIPRDGGPIGVMLYEHAQARRFTREMADALDADRREEANAQTRFHAAAHQYVELLTNHIHKEENILFNMADQVITGEQKSSLCGKFCEVGCREFGGHKREDLERMAVELEGQWST